jgi:SAM-dependent methyltransferase
MVTDDIISPDELETVEVCRICGSGTFHKAMDVGAWRLLRCESCNIIFTSPRYTREALSHLYESEYYEGAEAYFASQSASPVHDQLVVARLASRYVRSASPSSIDIGTGCGRQVAAFTALGFRAEGTEPSQLACEVANRNGRNIKNAAIETLPSEAWDCVTAIHVLEHIPEPLDFVRHLARIAAPNGVVIIEVPNFDSKASRRLGAKWTALYPSTHLFQFTPRTLSDVCRRAGLTVIATLRVGGAGIFEAGPDTPSTSPASSNTVAASAAPRPSRTGRLKQVLWNLRGPLLLVPGVRDCVRWINWEFFGHGEYVRIVARKPI